MRFIGLDSIATSATSRSTRTPWSIDPLEALGITPDRPLAYWGWGAIPDQYGWRSETDDGETPLPPDRGLTDLPPLRPYWGSGAH